MAVDASRQDVWLPEGIELSPSTIELLRFGAGFERWHFDDKTRRLAFGPALESIRSHYGSYRAAMRALAHEELSQ